MSGPTCICGCGRLVIEPNQDVTFPEVPVSAREIVLMDGTKVLVSVEDFEFLNQWQWHQSSEGYVTRNISNGDGTYSKISMHRLVAGASEKQLVDHANGVRTDNTRENVRIASKAQNNRNRPAKKKSITGIKGVMFRPDLVRPWYAVITFDGKKKYLGCFDSPQKACDAYNKAAIEFHGEFANLSFVPADIFKRVRNIKRVVRFREVLEGDEGEG